MNTHEDDRDVIGLLDRSVGDVHFDREADGIVSRGRYLRRRRRAMPALAAAGVLAASLSVAAVTQTQTRSASRSGATLAWAGTPVNVDNASYSVHTDAETGVVTVRLGVLGDPSQLQSLLRKAGIPLAIAIEPGTTDCTWAGAKTIGIPAGAVGSPTLDKSGFLTDMSTITFDPAKMPRGEVLGVVELTSHGQVAASTMQGLSNWPTGCETAH